ncbi:Ig-like domain-containing protein [Parvularcula sp. IMCC14364]|uniref:Ig-like domain-containing protein n=1 Tax=Parvularcula sp. IMCC14364 TaxID=3067902 RepID=UPI00274060A9|nr:Ig-like domain-containing protein [Parvularcula sp. IMCC14364]
MANRSKGDILTSDLLLAESLSASDSSFTVPWSGGFSFVAEVLDISFLTLPKPVIQAEVTNFQLKSGSMDSSLSTLWGGFQAAMARSTEDSGKVAAAAFREVPEVTMFGEHVVVDVTARDGNAAALLEELEELGLQYGAAFGGLVSGLLPVAALGALEAAQHVRYASASLMKTNTGSVTNQGDAAMLADDARATFSVDGTGLTIGTLSDSYDNLAGEAAGIASGDLPDDVIVLEDLGSGGSDEGRGMMELIFDTAPGADQLFHTAFLGQANFAQGIIDLQNAGADIIVDDVFYFAEPFFQDGIIAQAVDQVVGNGALYFSSAGNSGRDSWEDGFRASADTISGIDGTLHDFDSGAGDDARMNITLANNQSIRLSFQWDEPFAAAGGTGSASDVDIFLLNAGTDTIVAGSAADNIANGDPVEIFSFTNTTGSIQNYDIVISLFAGAAPGLMKFIDFDGATYNEYFTFSSTVVGHSNAEGANAIGASAFFFTPEFGQSPPVLNNFSSFGVTPIFFEDDGTRLATEEIRTGPVFTAPDGGNTTFFGSDSGADADAFPNFFGTSAAAPNAAAAAALLKEAVPTATNEQIIPALTETAIDIRQNSDGVPLAVGTDEGSGAGLIQVDDAIIRLQELASAGNTAPVAQDDDVTTDEDTVLTGEVLIDNGNGADSDADGDTLTITTVNGETADVGQQVTLASGALLTVNADGTFSYDPNGQFESLAVNETDTDSFTYTVMDDDTGVSSPATVTVTIDGVNDAPEFDELTLVPASVDEEGSITVDGTFLDPDLSDTHTITIDWGDGSSSTVVELTGGERSFQAEHQYLDDDPSGTASDDYTISFSIADNNAGGDSTTRDVTVSNVAPVATVDTATTDEDTVLSAIAVLSNDTDAAADTLTIDSIDSSGTVGLVADNGDGTITYDPNGQFEFLAAGESTTDTFSYTISDDDTGTDSATVTVTINGVNDAPEFDELTVVPASVNEEGSITVNGTFLDPDLSDTHAITIDWGDGFSSTVIELTAGERSFQAEHQYLDDDPSGTASDDYTISFSIVDNNAGGDSATRDVTVNNVAPVATVDTATTDEDTVLSAIAVLSNDTDAAADTLTIDSIDSSGTLGLVTDNGDGTITYDPNGQFEFLAAGESTTDTFSYTISDDDTGTDTATVTVTINGVNDAPTANDDALTVSEDDGPIFGSNLLDNDQDPDLTDIFSIFFVDGSGPNVDNEFALDSGALVTVNTDGSWVYNPNGQFEDLGVGQFATDEFDYFMNDGIGGSDGATVTVTILGQNDAPVASDDEFATDESISVTGNLFIFNGTGFDQDTDAGDSFTLTALNDITSDVGQETVLPSGALLLLNADGTFSYAPNGQYETLGAGETASDTFDYTITDGNGASATATVTIAISGVNDEPVAINDGYVITEDGKILDGDVFSDTGSGADFDIDLNDTLSVLSIEGNEANVGQQITLASGALLTLNTDGTFIYNTNGQFASLDTGESALETFTYTVTDGQFDQVAATFDPDILPSRLDGSDGFVINGNGFRAGSGRVVSSAGDFNADGIDDLLISADNQVNVVFGQSNGFLSDVELSSLDGANGFRVNGLEQFDKFGGAIAAAGDLNGDGIDDIIVGASGADGGYSNSGESYVIFGTSASLSPIFDLTDLDGTNGFVLDGSVFNGFSGVAVSNVGDLNGDGLQDVAVSAPFAGEGGQSTGQVYIVYGKLDPFAARFSFSELDGSNGFTINGIDNFDNIGNTKDSISGVGDVNGDGIDDLLIGAIFGGSLLGSGASYIVFGSTGDRPASLFLSDLDGTNGFTLSGSVENERSGYAVADIGDVNGDGFDDFGIGAPDSFVAGDRIGKVYVVFGTDTGVAPDIVLSTLNGANGFIINGIDRFDEAGTSLSSAGDINGDGLDDILIGAHFADKNNQTNSGQAYVVFGSTDGFGSNLSLSDLDGTTGFRITGLNTQDYVGVSVSSAGDVNGDGFDDLIVGASGADPNEDRSGETYVIFGRAEFTPVRSNTATVTITINGANDINILGTFRPETLTGGDEGENITGFGGNDTLIGNGGNDLIDGGNGRDIIDGGLGNDELIGGNGGDTIFGGEGDDIISGRRGSDLIDGGSGNDFIAGRGLTDIISGGDGNDDLRGNGGDDMLNGDAGDDTLVGGAGNDTLFGGDGGDILDGRRDDDILSGGAGNDVLFGKAGFDTFLFEDDFGNDVIADFNAADGEEDIDLSAVTAITDFADLENDHLTQDGLDALITDGANTIRLLNVNVNDLDATDFIF